jgi:hypothetical protein
MHSKNNSGEDIFTANQHKDRRAAVVTTSAEGKEKDKDKKEEKKPDHRLRKTF